MFDRRHRVKAAAAQGLGQGCAYTGLTCRPRLCVHRSMSRAVPVALGTGQGCGCTAYGTRLRLTSSTRTALLVTMATTSTAHALAQSSNHGNHKHCTYTHAQQHCCRTSSSLSGLSKVTAPDWQLFVIHCTLYIRIPFN